MNRRLSAVAAALALLAAACSASGASAAGDSEPIQVAFIGDFTNARAPYATASKIGVEIAFERINEAGGVDGRPLTLEVYDDLDDPLQTVNTVKRLSSDTVATIIASGSSGVLAAKEALEDQAIPYFVTVSSHPLVTSWGSKWVNRVHLSDADQINRLVEYAADELGMSQLAIVHDTSDFGQGGAELIGDALTERGLEPAITAPYNVGENDFTLQANQLRGSDVEGVLFWGLLDAGARLAEQMASLRLGDITLFGGGGLVSDEFISLSGAAAEGSVATWAYLDPDRELIRELTEEFRERKGGDLDVFGAQGFDSAMILAAALREAGADPEALQAAIRGIEHEGAVGRITFDANGQNEREIRLARVTDGEWKLLDDETL